MEPIGLVFKNEGRGKVGEIMLMHKCVECGVTGKNRIAGDDDEEVVLEVFWGGCKSPTPGLLTEKDEREIITQLYGRPEAEKRLGK